MQRRNDSGAGVILQTNGIGRLPRQQGSVLIIALVMLIVLAALAAGATGNTVLEQQMANNTLDQGMAFQAAETALRAGEAYIESLPNRTLGVPACVAPCVATLNSVNGGIFAGSAVLPWGSPQTAQVTTGAGVFAGAASPPEVVVEFHSFVPDPSSSLGIGTGTATPGSDFFRVTARGVGRTNNSQVIVQSTYARRF